MADLLHRTVFERANADPEWLARFTASYDGQFSPLDALWWFDHPDQPTPHGTRSPANRVAELRRSLYAPDGDQTAAAEYAAAVTGWSDDRAATIRAIEEAKLPTLPDLPSDGPKHGDAQSASVPRTQSRGIPRHTLVLCAASAVGVAALLVAGAARAPAHPAAHLSPTPMFVHSTEGWASAMPTTPASPVVDGNVLATVTNSAGSPPVRSFNGGDQRVSFALRCAGTGEVYVALSDNTAVRFVCGGDATKTVIKRSMHALRKFHYVITTGGNAVWSMRVFLT